jgi:hypothetical protein
MVEAGVRVELLRVVTENVDREPVDPICTESIVMYVSVVLPSIRQQPGAARAVEVVVRGRRPRV